MKLWLALIFTLIFSWFPLGLAKAANLNYVRVGEHGSFTRVVFEFQGIARSSEPTVIGIGKFSITFIDMTTALPRKVMSKATRGIKSVELIQEKTRLTANTRLSFPYFKLKTFSLSKPNRFVIDIYKISSPPKISELEWPLEAEPTDVKPITKEVHQTKPDKSVLVEPAKKYEMIQKKKFSKDVKYSVSVYILAILNALSLVIIALLILNILKTRPTVDSDSNREAFASLKATNERITAIDALIKKELEKLHQL